MALLTMSVLTALAVAGGCDPALPISAPQLTVQQSEPRDSTLLAGADTYPRQGDPQAIRGAVGGDSLASARLQLTIALNADNWSSSGRTIDLHRLTQAWTELGATWNCANDTSLTNPVADCAGETAWDMDGPNPRPWVPTPTATQVITNGLAGVVTLDVTADVADLLRGSGVLHGWLLKKTDEGASGRVDFGSRGSGSPPRLVLTTVPQAPQDTSRPRIPDGFNMPSGPPLTVPDPRDSIQVYFRNVVGVVFDDTTSGVTIRAILARYQAQVIGGYPRFREYMLQIPDPGPEFATVDSVVSALGREPGVTRARKAEWHTRVRLQGRWPNDRRGMTRSAWFDTRCSPPARPAACRASPATRPTRRK
jgi:hypothetical protein